MLFYFLFLPLVAFSTPDKDTSEGSLKALTTPNQAQAQNVQKDIQGYEKLVNQKYTLNMHKKTFLLPFSHILDPNQNIYSELESQEPTNRGRLYGNIEAEFQLSFFFPVTRKLFHTNWDILAAYTHRSWWQIYNNSWSRPFRETNYTPELFFRSLQKDPLYFMGLNLLSFDLGLVHESNGQTQTLSRAWDRLFARAYMSGKSFSFTLSTWYRLPDDRNLDGNPDIQDFRGYGEIEVSKSLGNWVFDGRLPIARRTGIEVSATYPIDDRHRFILVAFHGYGQSLIEYNIHSTRVGLGFSMENFTDRAKK